MIKLKKILLLLTILVFYLLIGKITAETELIPKDAIRIRVIANSDSEEDQKVKLAVKEELDSYFYSLLKDVKGATSARAIISSSVSNVEQIVARYTDDDYSVNYGLNYFPSKEYKGVFYKEGYYESLVVTLGEGQGKNWWCVLFPPLCLLENTEMEEVEYRSLVLDMIQQYF